MKERIPESRKERRPSVRQARLLDGKNSGNEGGEQMTAKSGRVGGFSFVEEVWLNAASIQPERRKTQTGGGVIKGQNRVCTSEARKMRF
jgi:hypothetical protein